MSIVAPVAPGASKAQILWTALVMLVPVVMAFPLFLLVSLLALGDPAGCPAGADPSTCGVAELDRDRGVLLTLTLFLPFALFLLTAAAVVVLAALRRRSIVVACIGVALMAVSAVGGLGYRILEL